MKGYGWQCVGAKKYHWQHMCLVKAIYYYFKLKGLWKLMSDCCFFHRGKLRLQ